MTGFVSLPPITPVTPPLEGEPSPQSVAADGFFPPIDCADLRGRMKVGTAITDERLREAVIGAITTALIELHEWRLAQVLAGYATAAAIPGMPQVDGQGWYEQLWRRAVSNYACAALAETYRDLSATGHADDRAEAKGLSAEDYRREGRYAVRDMLGEPRSWIELI
jgi:hypothetical protein